MSPHPPLEDAREELIGECQRLLALIALSWNRGEWSEQLRSIIRLANRIEAESSSPAAPDVTTNVSGEAANSYLQKVLEWARQLPPAVENPNGNSGNKSKLEGVALAAFKIIKQLKGRGIGGKALIADLDKRGFDISLPTFQKHIVPLLKQHGVKNIKALGGYCLDELGS